MGNQNTEIKRLFSISKILANVSRIADHAYFKARKNEQSQLFTGYPNLDLITSGFNSGDLIVIAGMPLSGKTTFALNLVRNTALNEKKAVAVFSNDLSATEIVMRLTTSQNKISRHKLFSGLMENEDWEIYTNSLSILNKFALYISDELDLRCSKIDEICSNIKKEDINVNLIVIDNFESILQYKNGDKQIQALEKKETLRCFKRLAKKLNCAVIVISENSEIFDYKYSNFISSFQDDREYKDDKFDYYSADFVWALNRTRYSGIDNIDKLSHVEIAVFSKDQSFSNVGSVKLSFCGETSLFEEWIPKE